MKRILICSILFIASLSVASAQQKGDKYIGGSLHLATATSISDGSSSTNVEFGLAPEFSYFVANKFRVGLSASYSLAHSIDFNITAHTLAIGPNIAYYVKLSDNFYYTPEFFIGFTYSGDKYLDSYGCGIALSIVGFEFKPKPNIGIAFNVLSLGYTFLSLPDWDISTNGLSFQLGLKSSIGFKYYF